MNHLASANCEDLKREVFVFEADKTMKLTCVQCKERVCFKNGKIMRPHFAHYANANRDCNYYSGSPGESRLHKDAKHCIRNLLKKNGMTIYFNYKCCECGERRKGKKALGRSTAQVECEVSAKKCGRIEESWVADVFRYDPRLIVEIKVTHATRTERPSPWYEIEAKDLMEEMKQGNRSEINVLDVSRGRRCKKCRFERAAYLWKLLLVRQRKARATWYTLVDNVVARAKAARREKIIYLWKLRLDNGARLSKPLFRQEKICTTGEDHP